MVALQCIKSVNPNCHRETKIHSMNEHEDRVDNFHDRDRSMKDEGLIALQRCKIKWEECEEVEKTRSAPNEKSMLR